jgi:AhpD family alkylhydroperoxidase
MSQNARPSGPQHLVRHIDIGAMLAQAHSNRQTQAVIRQMQLENAGVHGPFLIHIGDAELFAAVWALFREVQLAGPAPRRHQETLALIIAKQNRCPWCIEAHELALSKSTAVASVERWYQQLYQATPEQHQPLAVEHEVAYRAAVLLWEYINRMTNIFLIESAWRGFGRFQPALTGVLGWVFAAFFLHRRYQPGRALRFIRPAPLPAQFAWAAAVPTIASTLGSVYHHIERVGQAVISEALQQWVRDYLATYGDTQVAISRRWVYKATEHLPNNEKLLAQGLLLMALAGHQLDDEFMRALRQHLGSDQALIAVGAWASYAGAVRRLPLVRHELVPTAHYIPSKNK